MKHIVIIGAGFSGAIVAVHLLKQPWQEPVEITLVERQNPFAQGAAYSTENPVHLLNVTAGKMSAFPDQPDHLLQWLKKQYPVYDAASYIPRMIYAQYLATILQEAEAQKRFNTTFRKIQDEVLALETANESQYLLQLKSGHSLTVSAVVLAMGNFPPTNPTFIDETLLHSDRYIQNPWHQALPNRKEVIHHQPVLLIGTGLTMVDKVLELVESGYQGQMMAVSRHGLLPHAHPSVPEPVALTFDPLNQSPLALSRLLRKACQECLNAGGHWQDVISALRPFNQVIWSGWSLAERRQFIRHLRPYWDIHRHLIAPQIGSQLDALQQSGQLKVYAGRIKSMAIQESKAMIRMKPRHRSVLVELEAALVVNCIGPDTRLDKMKDPLIKSLFSQGLITADPLGLGLLADQQYQVVDKTGQSVEGLYAIGPLLKGLFWETIAVAELRAQAVAISSQIPAILAHQPQGVAISS